MIQSSHLSLLVVFDFYFQLFELFRYTRNSDVLYFILNFLQSPVRQNVLIYIWQIFNLPHANF